MARACPNPKQITCALIDHDNWSHCSRRTATINKEYLEPPEGKRTGAASNQWRNFSGQWYCRVGPCARLFKKIIDAAYYAQTAKILAREAVSAEEPDDDPLELAADEELAALVRRRAIRKRKLSDGARAEITLTMQDVQITVTGRVKLCRVKK
jgi:hypothetical protein